ncbi:MAG: exodeoxyribonuclease VII large subunit [Novosphingobium sp. 17-62-19]|uniref:exodeoxyribonuclease VII large subunit n=1 Tax=Novosphingobium sp. 17-62-19 TaxID=1970406 RepID=UPI000BDA1EA7|nr:exodeoxyribonuclease VII large subunit [Novosphingobium sp. 17-62-19]OYX95468.1 MAG: exodeoxyribonuclease VII large subunit [Novosphingobium sp. 35-62-5]OZA21081.1 MAG: exodeoxyribonuclease VII large subunit [Novosphingobium sp. 17-62-19]HQS95619.1 exodeoxyribonuclease VII large subunit [Novosphingobium sp.]
MAFPSAPYDDDDTSGSGGLLARESAGDNAPALSISEISALLKRTVEDRFGFVRVRGELSGVKRAASGHLYVSLKDESARLDGVMWRGNVQRLNFRPEDGVEVIATGKLTTYPGRSNYQIVIDRMEIAGEGALLALLAKLKARLEAEGLFDPARKKALPFLPRVIGVVTSPTGAVIRDILHRLSDRFPTRVVVWPVLVQGQGAGAQVANAVRGFSALPEGGSIPRPDLVIVARGGGSIEDLWCFNEEEVVRAVADCTIPIISAVGHETDTTLSDFAADLRAPTPTAAAELAVPVQAELAAFVADLNARQRRALARQLAQAKERLEARSQRLPQPQTLLQGQAQRVDDLAERLRRALLHRTEIAGSLLARHAGALRPSLLTARVDREAERLAARRLRPEVLLQRIEHARAKVMALDRLRLSLDPEAPLKRGYVLVTDADGQLVKDRATAANRPSLTLKFADGTLDVSTGGTAPTPRPAPKPRPPAPRAGQQELF